MGGGNEGRERKAKDGGGREEGGRERM